MDGTSARDNVEMAMTQEDELKQRAFYASVRETIISLLLVVVLYLLSYWLVTKYKRHRTREECYAGEEDATVYRVATWLCSFALCISLGSALLLPLSIIGNEVLVHCPDSRYVQWLNTSLIQGLWNQVFLGCNISLFFLLPFAFFFTESAGFAGSRKGVMPRVYETVLLVGLVLVMMVVMVAIVTSFVFSQDDQYSLQWWLSYVPLLYSLVSMVGVALMSVCTPLGFSSLFTLLGETITRPILHNVEEELEMLKFEESAIQRRYTLPGGVAVGARLAMEEEVNLEKIQRKRRILEHRLHSSPWERNCLYPLCFLFLVAVTLLALALVAINILALIINPAEQLSVQEYLLGKESTSQLGSAGSVLEAGLIVYFMCASVVGVYSTPLLQRWLLPTLHDTPMTKIIANCVVLLMLSSALPLLSRILGITKFNLLGYFSSLKWQRSFWLLLSYNVLFLTITSMILCQRVTRSIVREASWLLGAKLVFRTKTAVKGD